MRKPNYALYSLNIVAISVYLLVFFNLNITVSEKIMFVSSDAVTYMDVVKWMEHGIEHESVSTRPFLYPVLLMLSLKMNGVYGVWIMQAIFWILAINFTFLSIKQITKNNWFAFLGAVLLMANTSLIALTLHALTEVTTVFLLSMMLFFLARKIEEYRNLQFLHTCLFFLVLLTLVKPVFYIPLLGTIFIFIPLIYLKKYRQNPKSILKLLLILLPLITQLGLMKVKYDQTTVSLIAPKTLSRYFMPQGIIQVEPLTFDEAVVKAEAMTKKQQRAYMKSHAKVYVKSFTNNMINNIKGDPTFLLYPEGHESPRLAPFMKSYNKSMSKVHLFFLLLIFPLSYQLFKQKNIPMVIFLLFPFLLSSYYLFATGVSFWQGDRLTLASIAIWAVIYPLIFFFYVDLYKKKKRSGNVVLEQKPLS